MPNGRKKHKNKIKGETQAPSFNAPKKTQDSDFFDGHQEQGSLVQQENRQTQVDMLTEDEIAQRLKMLWDEKCDGPNAFTQEIAEAVEKVEKPVDNSVRSVEKEVSAAVDQVVDRIFDTFFKWEQQTLPALRTLRVRSGKLWDTFCGKLDKAVDKAAHTMGASAALRAMAEGFIKQETKAADAAAKAVEAMDGKINDLLKAAGSKTEKLRRFSQNRKKQGVQFVKHNKQKAALCGGSCAVLAVAAILVVSHFTAYEYMYNGKTLGVVKDRDDVYKIVDVIGEKIGQTYHTQIKIDKEDDISFKRVFLAKEEADSEEDILNRLTYMNDMKAKGFAILIDGKQVAVLESKDAAEEVLSAVKDQYIDEENRDRYKKVNFIEEVQIKSLDAKLGELQNHDDVYQYLLTGQTEKKIHVVADGETLSEIAKIYGMKLADLEASNPGIDPAKIFIGQEISLVKSVSMLDVRTEEIVAYAESIPYEIQYEDADTKFEGENTVKEEGLPGEKLITAKIIKENGEEATKEILKEETTIQPIAQVVLRGTKKQPELVGTGSFVYPTRGRITSPYGSRWGSFHPALDIAAPSGTPIKAADGGQVVESGYSGSYGNMVKIDHGGGRVTLYAHCSKLLVQKGERVSQGQMIANVGSTGNSTGPHVHFEVRINGTTQNPLNYL